MKQQKRLFDRSAMGHAAQKIVSFVKKYKILSVVLTLVIALCSWWAWGELAPHPLGDGMTYLGKKDYGNIFGFDSRPNSTYYYGTDMNIGQVAEHFDSVIIENETTPNGTVEFGIKLPSGETIYSQLYPATESHYKTTKKSVIEIPSFKYDAARKYLAK